MTALLIDAVTSDFFYGWVIGSIVTIGLIGFFSYRRYKRDTLYIREAMDRVELNK